MKFGSIFQGGYGVTVNGVNSDDTAGNLQGFNRKVSPILYERSIINIRKIRKQEIKVETEKSITNRISGQ